MKTNPCVSISLLFGRLLMASTARTFSADASGGNLNTSTNLLGGKMTGAAAPTDQKPMLPEGIDWKAYSLTKAAAGAKPHKSFRLLDGALISVGASHESFQRPDRELIGYSDFASSRSWAGPDATRQPAGPAAIQVELEMIYGAKAVQAGNNRCFVCETPIADLHGFAQVKHGDWTIRLCCRQCAQDFFAQRLPVLRRVGFQMEQGSLAWPRRPVQSGVKTK